MKKKRKIQRRINKSKIEWEISAVNRLFSNSRASAMNRGLAWSISKKFFANLIRSNCYYCNAPPSNVYQRKGRRNPIFFYTGIDRLNNNKGYTKDNVAPCCSKCNKLKSNLLTAEQAKVVIKALLEYNSLHNLTWSTQRPIDRCK